MRVEHLASLASMRFPFADGHLRAYVENLGTNKPHQHLLMGRFICVVGDNLSEARTADNEQRVSRIHRLIVAHGESSAVCFDVSLERI